MKYIIFETSGGLEVPIIFPCTIKHDEVKLADLGAKPIRAGMISIDYKGKIHCNGESLDLKLKSDPEQDSHWINRCFEDY